MAGELGVFEINALEEPEELDANRQFPQGLGS
jgi:hypothetical protein